MLYNDTEYTAKRGKALSYLKKGWYGSAVATLEELVAVAGSKDPDAGILLEKAGEGANWVSAGKMPATPVDPMAFKEVAGGLPD